MSARPWMPFYVGDYVADTSHLTTLEHGAYVLLLLAYWQRGGPLPDDSSRLANIARMPTELWVTVEPTIRAFFVADGGLLVHRRVDRELAKMRDKAAQAAHAGRASAQRRRNARSTDVQRTSNNSHSHSHSDPNQNNQNAPLLLDSAAAREAGAGAEKVGSRNPTTGVGPSGEPGMASERVQAESPDRPASPVSDPPDWKVRERAKIPQLTRETARIGSGIGRAVT